MLKHYKCKLFKGIKNKKNPVLYFSLMHPRPIAIGLQCSSNPADEVERVGLLMLKKCSK